MSLGSAVGNGLFRADSLFAGVSLRLFGERKSLLILTLHGLTEEQPESLGACLEPRRLLHVHDLAHLIEHLLDQDYRFVSVGEIAAGLPENGKAVALTFDDGYFNNRLGFHVLRNFEVPSVFFASTNHVRCQKSFWWDALYREMRKRGISEAKIGARKKELKNRTHREIEDELRRDFGPRALDPVGDMDRPFKPEELRALSLENNLSLGNHTRDHAILPNYARAEAEFQISGAQEDLFQWTGTRPIVIAYPDGRYSRETLEIARGAGLKLGMSVDFGKNRLPLPAGDFGRLMLKRCGLRPGHDSLRSVRILRADFTLHRMQGGMTGLRRRRIAFSGTQS